MIKKPFNRRQFHGNMAKMRALRQKPRPARPSPNPPPPVARNVRQTRLTPPVVPATPFLFPPTTFKDADTMKLAGFLKVKDEILRAGNIYRVLRNIDSVCDCGVIADDASMDGTTELLEEFVSKRPSWRLLKIAPQDSSFEKELFVKQQMLRLVDQLRPDWVLWLDADEVLDAGGTANLRQWLASQKQPAPGYRFHYVNLWKFTNWARTDDGFDSGSYIKLWRYAPGLSFDTKLGTHHAQFPQQAMTEHVAPFEVIHYGNVGVNLRWKAIQYANGRGGVDRHIAFGHSPAESLASGVGFDRPDFSAASPQYQQVSSDVLPPHAEQQTGPRPAPFSLDHIKRIRSFGNLRNLPETFAVIVPAFNRATFLPKTLDSLLAQTYDKWVCFVLDDGSADNTTEVLQRYQELDPRIFYARYPVNRGGVAANEVGMGIACEVAEWWTRLGSDDWFGPRKLELDAWALRRHGACWGCYQVQRTDGDGTRLEEVCNRSLTPKTVRSTLFSGGFVVSWANVAVRTSVLREVRGRFGHFVDPRLRNMEDFLANAYIAAVTDFRWRGVVKGQFCDAETPGLQSEVLEAVWNDCTTGASGNLAQSAKDDVLTREVIAAIPGIK